MENEKTLKKFVEPEIEIILLSETDIITTSGGPFDDNPIESEMI